MRATTMFVAAVLLSGTYASAQDGAAFYAKHCAQCHDGGVPRTPTRETISALSRDRIVASLETGLMRVQGEPLTPQERRAIAAFLSTARAEAPAAAAGPTCAPTAAPPANPIAANAWNGWGPGLANERFQRDPGIAAAQVPSLKLRWAFGFEGETSAAAQPSIVGDRVYVGSNSGRVYSLGLRDGCVHWTFKAEGGVRSAIWIANVNGATAFFGDTRAVLYSLDATTGALRWKKTLDEHSAARITGSLVFHEGRLYVPISSTEEASAAQAAYECCTFRGSVVALDAKTGDEIWRTYLVAEPPTPRGKNRWGAQSLGPSGAAVWSAPTVDVRSGLLYVATGDNYSQPTTDMSDAVVAIDMNTGAVRWSQQLTKGDAYTMACGGVDTTNCPEDAGPDFDFGQPPMLIALPNGRRALVLAQKSGVAHGLDPDRKGLVLWSTRVGRGGELGGSEWGSATDGTLAYVAVSDLTFRNRLSLGRGGLDSTVGGGLFALKPSDGSKAWTAAPPVCGDRPNCSPAQSAPVSVMPGAVFSGSVDGHLRAYSTTDGAVIWQFDTSREFDTVNGVKANGGAIDVGGVAIGGGRVVTTSGYGQWGGRRGNVLLAFGVDDRP